MKLKKFLGAVLATAMVATLVAAPVKQASAAEVGTKIDLTADDGSITTENLNDGIQAKDMTLNGEVISNKVIGLKPTSTDVSSKVSFKVTVDKAGKYNLIVTYNAKGDSRPMAVKVNDGKATDVALASTGDDYTTCSTKTIEVELVAGENTITFSQASTYDNSSVKAPNLVFAVVTAQQTTPQTGVATMVIPAAVAMVASGAVALKTSKKKEN